MRTFLMLGAAAAAALAASYAALADDSEAQLLAGGLVLMKNANIRMASEDLTITPTDVRVRYEFANDSGHDIDTTVAFPLPKLDLYEYSETPLGATTGDPVNFVGFEVRENGRPIQTQLQAHAIHDGKDVSAAVRAAGLPIGIYSDSFNRILAALPVAKLNALERAGLMEVDGDSRRPKWTVELMYFWNEHFPKGQTVVIEHHYRPVTGSQFYGRFSVTDPEQAKYWKTFCIDPATQAAINKGIDVLEKHGQPYGSGMYLAYTTGFVITTGNNWKGPIGRFHLTVDKMAPDNILSLCWDAAPLRKTGPSRFESTVMNFAPRHDINMVVLTTKPIER